MEPKRQKKRKLRKRRRCMWASMDLCGDVFLHSVQPEWDEDTGEWCSALEDEQFILRDEISEWLGLKPGDCVELSA